MSEVRQADEAVHARAEAMSSLLDSEGVSALDVYRRVFLGMGIDAADVLELSHLPADAQCELIKQNLDDGEEFSLNDYLSAAWMDGFSVAAMLFLRRTEGKR